MAAVLNAEQRAEEWAARRTFFGRICIFLSLPMAYLLFRGTRSIDPEARLVLAVWAVAFASAIGCAAAGVRAQRIADALLKGAGGQRINPED